MNRTPSDDYDDDLIRHIFRTTRAFSRTLNNKVFTQGLHSSEWMLLNLIYLNDGMSQADLIQYFAIEPAAITRTLVRLEKKALIQRESLHTGRAKFIRLTPKGLNVCETLEPSVIQHRRQALEGISVEDRQKLLALMESIYQRLE